MTPIADMVRKLFEKGVDQEAILIAIEAAEQVMSASLSTRHPPDSRVDEAAEKRREWDREYRRRTRTSTRHPPESTRHPPDTENVPLSIERKKEEKEERKRETTRGARLPVGWTPTPQDLVVAEELLGEPKTKTELEKFRDHWAQQPGQRGIKLDWSAAWRNWVRRAAEYSKPRGTSPPARPLTQHQLERQESREILDDLQKFIDGSTCSSSDADTGLLRLDPGDGQESVHGGFRRNVVDLPPGRTRQGT